MDQITEGLVKELPILKTVSAFYKFGKTVREQHTILKLIKFLSRLDEVSEQEKAQFLLTLGDEDKAGKLFEQLIIQIDRLEDAVKAEMIGNIFRIYMLGKLTRHTFLRSCAVL